MSMITLTMLVLQHELSENGYFLFFSHHSYSFICVQKYRFKQITTKLLLLKKNIYISKISLVWCDSTSYLNIGIQRMFCKTFPFFTELVDILQHWCMKRYKGIAASEVPVDYPCQVCNEESFQLWLSWQLLWTLWDYYSSNASWQLSSCSFSGIRPQYLSMLSSASTTPVLYFSVLISQY